MTMRLGEICLHTDNVRRLSDFYKKLLGVENDSDDDIHQTIIAEETMLTIWNNGENGHGGYSAAFTVDDINAEYERLEAMGVEIVEPPTKRPWGATNMCILDPDKNKVYLRSFK